MAATTTGNPYQPGRGVLPPVLAGRDSLLAEAEERLDLLATGRMPSQDLLFYGPRGTGKTSLLLEIGSLAGARRLGVDELPVHALSGERQLVRHLQERAGVLRDRVTGLHSPWIKRPAREPVLEEMGNPIVRADAGRFPHRMAARIAGAIRSAVFRGEGGPSPPPSPAALRAASAREGLSPQPLQVAGVGFSATQAAPSEDVGRLFAAWTRAAAGPQVILMDEVHALSPKAARPFFDAVQSARSGPRPFLLLAAGTPDAPRRVREAATYNERGFRQLPVGRLRRPETITALAEPARRSGCPMSGEAAELLAAESQDYPYFIQLLGSAAWRAAAESGAAGIGSDAARQGVAACGPEVERFYSGRYEEAWKRRIAPALEPLATRFAERGGCLAQWDLLERLVEIAAPESFPRDEVSLLNDLRDLGVIWEATPGVWEMGIPSFADFILRRARPSG